MSDLHSGRQALRVLAAAGRHFREDACEAHAASIAFFALLSLVPLAALVLLVIGLLFGRTEPEDARWIVSVFGQGGELQPEVLQNLRRLADMHSVKALPLLLTMVVAGSLVFGALQAACARIFAGRGRGYLRDRLRSVGLMGASAVALVLLFGLRQTVKALTGRVDLVARLIEADPAVALALAWALGLTAELAVFFALFRFLPRRPVGSRAALAGAVLTTFLWELLRVGFGIYADRVWTHGAIYGPLEAVILVALWLYGSTLTFLFGAEVVAVLNGDRPI